MGLYNGKFKHHLNNMDFIYLKKKPNKLKSPHKRQQKTDIKEPEDKVSFELKVLSHEDDTTNKNKFINENSSKDMTFALQNRQSLNDTITSNSYHTCMNEFPSEFEGILDIKEVVDKKIDFLEGNTNPENDQTMKELTIIENKDRNTIMNEEISSCLKNNYKRKLKSRMKKMHKPIEKLSSSVDNVVKLMKKLSNGTVVTDRKSIRRVLFSKKYKNSSDIKLTKNSKNSSKNNDNRSKSSSKNTQQKRNFAKLNSVRSHSTPSVVSKQDRKPFLEKTKSLSHLIPACKVYLTPSSAMAFSKQLEDLEPFVSLDIESEGVELFGFSSHNYQYDPVNEIFYYAACPNTPKKTEYRGNKKRNHNNNNKLGQWSFEQSTESLSNTMLEKRGLYHSQKNNCNSIRFAYLSRFPFSCDRKHNIDACKKEEVVKSEEIFEVSPLQSPSNNPIEYPNQSYSNLQLNPYPITHPSHYYEQYQSFDKNPQTLDKQLEDFYTCQKTPLSRPTLRQRRHLGSAVNYNAQPFSRRPPAQFSYKFFPNMPY